LTAGGARLTPELQAKIQARLSSMLSESEQKPEKPLSTANAQPA